ncbi:MAG: pirin family protein [Archangium sp.]
MDGKVAPVGDFTVTRALPQVARRFVGPFCFVDHMGPHQAIGRADGGVGPHPHIGLSTVTYLFEGEVLHRRHRAQRAHARSADWKADEAARVAGVGRVADRARRR